MQFSSSPVTSGHLPVSVGRAPNKCARLTLLGVLHLSQDVTPLCHWELLMFPAVQLFTLWVSSISLIALLWLQ